MQASKLRQRITVFAATELESETGANGELEFRKLATLWANIEPLSVKDVLNAKSVNSYARLRCIIRYRTDIDSSMQIVYNDKTYKIDGDPLADKSSGREYLTLILASI